MSLLRPQKLADNLLTSQMAIHTFPPLQLSQQSSGNIFPDDNQNKSMIFLTPPTHILAFNYWTRFTHNHFCSMACLPLHVFQVLLDNFEFNVFHPKHHRLCGHDKFIRNTETQQHHGIMTGYK